MTFRRSVGSSFTLAQQLSELEPHVCSQNAPLAAASDSASAFVRAGFDMLSNLAKLSVQHGLPIIFWG